MEEIIVFSSNAALAAAEFQPHKCREQHILVIFHRDAFPIDNLPKLVVESITTTRGTFSVDLIFASLTKLAISISIRKK